MMLDLEQFYKLLTHTRKAVSKLDYKTIGRKAGVLRKQFQAFGNMVNMEERFHETLGAAQDKLITEGVPVPIQAEPFEWDCISLTIPPVHRQGTRWND